MEQDDGEGVSSCLCIVRHNQSSPYYVQHRHDVLMKFFNLMQQHNDDLGRLIVSSNNLFLTSLGAHLSLDS